MLVASGLSPYGGLYRVLSAPACGNRWGPSMDNLLPMYERKLSLPRKARSPLPGSPFSPFGWPGSRKARLTTTYFPDVFQMALARRLTLAPLRMSNNLHCGYWSAVSPCVSSTQVGGPPRQRRQRSSATLPREKKHPGHPAETRCLCCRGGAKCGGPPRLPPLPVGRVLQGPGTVGGARCRVGRVGHGLEEPVPLP